jgi:hydrogenase maturation protease
MKILLIGYGNPGRLDDGLGPLLAGEIEAAALNNVTVESDYQLNVEDAETIARHDVVILADAATTGPEPFSFSKLQAAEDTLSFSTHSVTPGEALGLARQLFNASTDAWLLGIRGYEFNEYEERISEPARANLNAAVAALTEMLRTEQFTEIRPVNTGPDNEGQ